MWIYACGSGSKILEFFTHFSCRVHETFSVYIGEMFLNYQYKALRVRMHVSADEAEGREGWGGGGV
jgi:hypothetical protein